MSDIITAISAFTCLNHGSQSFVINRLTDFKPNTTRQEHYHVHTRTQSLQQDDVSLLPALQLCYCSHCLPSVHWHCWLGVRKSICPVKSWVMRYWVVICLQQDANDLHMVQPMPHQLMPSSLASLNPDWFNLTAAGLHTLSWKQGHWMGVCLVGVSFCYSKLSNRITLKWTSGYATWFKAGGAIRIAHYDVIDDVITRKLQQIEKNGDHLPHAIIWVIQWWKPHRSTTIFAKPEMTPLMTS